MDAASALMCRRQLFFWLSEEMAVMRELPARRMESAKRERVKVDSGSLIHVGNQRPSGFRQEVALR
jgi:hypothetical protein